MKRISSILCILLPYSLCSPFVGGADTHTHYIWYLVAAFVSMAGFAWFGFKSGLMTWQKNNIIDMSLSLICWLRCHYISSGYK